MAVPVPPVQEHTIVRDLTERAVRALTRMARVRSGSNVHVPAAMAPPLHEFCVSIAYFLTLPMTSETAFAMAKCARERVSRKDAEYMAQLAIAARVDQCRPLENTADGALACDADWEEWVASM